ncbi:hypothetical protein K503DRAFT_766577 [Rhizopogon vinicolor AM-OR11-026]|uniref:Uncharacterized protein n=1 Tax=Rhizopogon vinicolor AM-OR11-026 TaxID=1314800 RepID=A0A1B7NCJ8_9AGAM|nr:hypothetical protein K503DRAFT_766577 [Rhizopogon vinicolor AM-OR11-026]
MTSYPDDLKNMNQGPIIVDDSDFSEEEEYAPEPEDLIQDLISDFPERGPQGDLAARARKNKDKNQDNQPNITKRPTNKEPKKVEAGNGKYEEAGKPK